MATLTLHDDPLPLKLDEHGRVRVGGTRVFLPILVRAFNEGRTPDEIADSYDTLTPADIYTVIGYYLRHRAEVDEYVRRHDAEEDAFEAEWRAKHPHLFADPEKLRARWAARNEAATP